jgi:hypothetical protein
MLDTGDVREAADSVVAALMQGHNADEIREAFKFDGAIKMAVGNYLGENDVDDFEDEEEDELLNQYNDDGEFNYDEY